MNWKLIFQLSVFGLIMAVATISLIPEKVEPIFWFIIFAFCAWVIAKACNGKYFLHGFLVSLVNCIWIVGFHALFYNIYILNHPHFAAMNANLPGLLSSHPRRAMVLMGPVFGIIFGIILGLFSFIASKIVKK